MYCSWASRTIGTNQVFIALAHIHSQREKSIPSVKYMQIINVILQIYKAVEVLHQKLFLYILPSTMTRTATAERNQCTEEENACTTAYMYITNMQFHVQREWPAITQYYIEWCTTELKGLENTHSWLNCCSVLCSNIDAMVQIALEFQQLPVSTMV